MVIVEIRDGPTRDSVMGGMMRVVMMRVVVETHDTVMRVVVAIRDSMTVVVATHDTMRVDVTTHIMTTRIVMTPDVTTHITTITATTLTTKTPVTPARAAAVAARTRSIDTRARAGAIARSRVMA